MDQAAEHRIFVDAHKETQRNAEYKKHVRIVIELGHKIKEHLGTHRALFTEYEREVGLLEGLFMENVYRAGVEDGQRITSCLGSCSTKCSTKTESNLFAK